MSDIPFAEQQANFAGRLEDLLAELREDVRKWNVDMLAFRATYDAVQLRGTAINNRLLQLYALKPPPAPSEPSKGLDNLINKSGQGDMV